MSRKSVYNTTCFKDDEQMKLFWYIYMFMIQLPINLFCKVLLSFSFATSHLIFVWYFQSVICILLQMHCPIISCQTAITRFLPILAFYTVGYKFAWRKWFCHIFHFVHILGVICLNRIFNGPFILDFWFKNEKTKQRQDPQNYFLCQ